MVVDYRLKGACGRTSRSLIPGGAGLDLHPDGKRFAVFPRNDIEGENKGSLHVTFLLNFFDELRRRVPEVK